MNEELKIIISATTDKLKQGVKEAQKAVEKLGNETKTVSSKVEKAFSTMGKAAKSAGSAIGKGLAAAGAAGAGLLASTTEMRQNLTRVEAAAKQAGVSAKTATNAWKSFNNVIGDSDAAAEATQQLLRFADSASEIDHWSTIAAGSIAMFGDALPIETLMEGVNETVSLGEATGGVVQAIEQLHGDVGEFNKGLSQCTTAEERAAYAMEYFNDTLGEAGEQYLKSIERQNAFNNSMFDVQLAMSKAASALLPLATILTGTFASALETITPALDKVGTSLANMISGIEGSGEQLAAGFEELVTTATTKMAQAIPNMLNTGTNIVLAISDGISSAMPTVLKTAAELIPQIITTIVDNIPKMLESGVAMIQGIVDGLVSATPTLTASVPEIVTSVVDALTNSIPVLIEGAIQLFNAIVQAIPIIIPEIIAALPQIITSLVNGLVTAIPQLIQGGVQLFLALVQAIPVVIPQVVAAIPQIITAIGGALVDAVPNVLKAAKEMFMAIPNAIADIIPSLGEALGGVFDNIVGFFTGTKDEVDKSSTDIANTVDSKFSGMASDMSSHTQNAANKVNGNFSQMQTQTYAKMNAINSNAAATFGSFSGTIGTNVNLAQQSTADAMAKMNSETQKVMNKLKQTTKTSMDAVKNSSKFTWSLPKLKMPHINISGKFSINPPSVPRFSISWYAKGGVFDSPTLFPYGNGRIGGLGEAGAEAIVPLEKNTKWLDKIAEKLGSGQTAQIVLQVDGKTFAQTAVTSINNLTRQQGKLSLNLT